MDRQAAEDFLYREARLLDEGKWREWQKLFTTDAIYWIPSNAADIDPELHVSFVYDNMQLLEDRLWRLESGRAVAQEVPSVTLHQIGNVEVEQSASDSLRLFSNLVLYEFRDNSQMRMVPLQIFPARCEHRLRRENDHWKICFKKVSLLTCDGEITDLSFLI